MDQGPRPWRRSRATLPDAARAEVRFKRPILLPGRVSFASAPLPDRAPDVAFAVRDARKGTPHLEGLLSAA